MTAYLGLKVIEFSSQLINFANSIPKANKNNSSLCVGCRNQLQNIQDLNDLQAKSKHKIISYTNKNVVSFECCNCQTIGQSSKASLLVSNYCKKCSGSQFRKDFDDLQQEVKECGLTLLTLKKDYTDNKHISVLCDCGNKWNCSLNDIKRNRKCMNCRTERTYATNNIKYGVNNVFENEDIKKKCVATCLKNNGVEYAQQSEEIREKTTNTCLEKYGYKRAFCEPKVYEKIQDTCLEKYGVKFPLQSAMIQEKINETFLSICGKTRPFGTEYHNKIILEKYGNTIFVCSDYFKEQMMEKYGSEYFVTSEECKKQMVEKYGSEYFVTSEECKKQMMQKYGSEYFVTSEECKKQMLEKYGSEYFVNSEECKKQMMEKYGSEYFVNSEECKKQMMEKYGVEYAMQSSELFSKMLKTSFRRREYTFEDGTTSMILGYEDLAIKDLEESKLYSVIEAGDNEKMPTFWYDFEEKKHKYYPDIFLPEVNTIIEVKSTYYFEKDMPKNICKAKEVSKTFIFLVYVYTGRKDIKTVYKLKDEEFIILE